MTDYIILGAMACASLWCLYNIWMISPHDLIKKNIKNYKKGNTTLSLSALQKQIEQSTATPFEKRALHEYLLSGQLNS